MSDHSVQRKSAEEWNKKHIEEYYSVLQKKENLPHVKTWMIPEDVEPSKRTWKDNY